jgi:hypothetical protein
MRHFVRLPLAILVTFLVVSLVVPIPARSEPPCALCSQGDQEGGSVVTEATEFPDAGPGSDLAKATGRNAGCTDCEWSLVPACSTTGPTTPGDVLCNGAAATCQVAGQLRYLVYMRHPPGPWLMQGTICLGRKQRPPTVADVGDAVRERVVNYLPDADPSFQPAEGGIVNLPTLFAAGEPRTMRTAPFDVLGFQVVVTATARWEWTFDDGVTREFARPGGAYPNDDVA